MRIKEPSPRALEVAPRFDREWQPASGRGSAYAINLAVVAGLLERRLRRVYDAEGRRVGDVYEYRRAAR